MFSLSLNINVYHKAVNSSNKYHSKSILDHSQAYAQHKTFVDLYMMSSSNLTNEDVWIHTMVTEEEDVWVFNSHSDLYLKKKIL